MKAAEARALMQAEKPRKFRNRKVEVDGFKFDSVRESVRYGELKLLERSKKISALSIHPKYNLTVGVHKVGTYAADFQYHESGFWVVEDVKSKPTMTQLFRWKAKHLEAQYGIKIRIVT